MENQLVKIVEQTGLEKTKSEVILDSFTGFFKQAKEWESKAKGLVVTDEKQTDLMKQAREGRLALKEIRVNAEKARKELKEQSLREGKAIDGIANVIKALVVPIEEHLEKQEKFAEIIEEERKEKTNQERVAKLTPYVGEEVGMYNLKEMSPEAFEKLLDTHRKAFEAQKKAEEEVEKERIEKEKAEREEQERIRKENETLKKEAEARERKEAEERKKREAEMKKIEEQRKKEAEEKAKLEAELQKKKEEEERARQQAEEEARKKEETERQAKLAPEKDKLTAYAERIKTIEAPQDLSKAGMAIIKEAESKLLALSQEIKEKIKDL